MCSNSLVFDLFFSWLVQTLKLPFSLEMIAPCSSYVTSAVCWQTTMFIALRYVVGGELQSFLLLFYVLFSTALFYAIQLM